MFQNIENQIIKKYNRNEEYLIDHYPSNYFDYYIDIGTRGTKHPWHIDSIAANNPKTLCIGYEPDIPYYKELIDKTRHLSNVKIYSNGFSTQDSIKTPSGSASTVSLEKIIIDNHIDIDSKWAIKFDCEGCEYCLLEQKYNVDVLKKAAHISIEFHIQGGKKNFFTNLHNNLPSSFQIPEEWIKENFSDSHTILITSYEKDLGVKAYAVLSNTVVSSADLLFWKDLL